MKRLIRKLLWFFVPVATFLIVAETYLRSIPTTYSEKARGLASSDPEILILGNSHAAYGVNPVLLHRNAYNAANVYQSIYFDKRLALKWLDSLPKLRLVLISVDFHSLYFSSMAGRNAWAYMGYGINYKDSLDFWDRHSSLVAFKAKMAWEFFRRHRSGRYDSVRAVDVENGVDKSHPFRKGGYQYVGTAGLADADVKTRADFFNKVVVNDAEHASVPTDLAGLIKTLRYHGITPVLFSAPIHKKLRVRLNPEVARRNAEDIATICRTQHIRYWDFQNLPLPDAAFYNCDHLNAQGASQFTAVVADSVEAVMDGRYVRWNDPVSHRSRSPAR